jgi:site-specific recombinase XerC
VSSICRRLAGIRRTIGTAPRRKAAADRLRAMLNACPDTMLGIRDRALLALGFAGAFRRSELVALQVDDLTEVADGFRVTIRRSKTDQTGEGQEIVIPRGLKIRPVEAVQGYLKAAGVVDGVLFRVVHRGGYVRSWGAARA